MVGERPKPFGEALGFDPITSTLIFGEHDTVLVDAMMLLARLQNHLTSKQTNRQLARSMTCGLCRSGAYRTPQYLLFQLRTLRFGVLEKGDVGVGVSFQSGLLLGSMRWRGIPEVGIAWCKGSPTRCNKSSKRVLDRKPSMIGSM